MVAKMALQGVLRSNRDLGVGMYLVSRRNARRVLVRWLRRLGDGKSVTLDKVAREEGFSPRKLRRVLRADPKLSEEFLGPLDLEAKLAMRTAVERGLDILTDEETPSTEIRLWTELFAKLLGGGFDARKSAPLLILQQLVPDLPPQARHIQAKVLETKEDKDVSLESLTEEI